MNEGSRQSYTSLWSWYKSLKKLCQEEEKMNIVYIWDCWEDKSKEWVIQGRQ